MKDTPPSKKTSQASHKASIQAFLNWFGKCKGSERGEGQIFFDRLFKAFGNKGVLEAGAVCEVPVRKSKQGGVIFPDLVWRPRVIIELKKRGTSLKKYYDQAFNYWVTLVPHRPRYMVLCNFDEFWIYDLNTQLYDPVHKFYTKNIMTNWGALKFLLPVAEEPLFDNSHIAITQEVAKSVGQVYLSLVERGISKDKAQRFILQLVIALFSEDVGLIPQYTVQEILKKSAVTQAAQKELSFLFKAMALKNKHDKPKKYRHISYFNGGIFKKTTAVELVFDEIEILHNASRQNWSKVKPSIFGSLFESSISAGHRHRHGIYYTHELDIHKIVYPSIVAPFKEKIKKAKTQKDKRKILREIQGFKVLDPACGSGNFLYIAFRELRKLEMEILESLNEGRQIRPSALGLLVSPQNFYGIDTNPFGLELAKVALSIGRKLLADEFNIQDPSLPFDDLDSNFLSEDALFSEWPKVDAIIGNPPFQSKNKIQQEMGVSYINKLRKHYKDVPGRADYCVYWFRKAHDNLSERGRAGLVGTNTIRENYSREGGLDYIVQNGGIITEAVSSQKWPGAAVVHVSLVNWTKNKTYKNKIKTLFIDSKSTEQLEPYRIKKIPSSLSVQTDIFKAKILRNNQEPKTAYQGQTHGHKAFLISATEAEKLTSKNLVLKKVLKPFLTANDLIKIYPLKPKRYVIDFANKNLIQARKYKPLYNLVKKEVLPHRKREAEKEKLRKLKALKTNSETMVNRHHYNFLKNWWKLSWPREDLMKKIKKLNRYCVCSQVTQRQIFEFISSNISPNASLIVFPFEDDYSFGILHSHTHWLWFTNKCSTLGVGFRYTINTVYDTFPWPQNPTLSQIKKVAEAARELRKVRRQILTQNNISYRELYRAMELPGEHKLLKYHKALNEACSQAYGFKQGADELDQLLKLNLFLAKKEAKGLRVQGPGLPHIVKNPQTFTSKDCVLDDF